MNNNRKIALTAVISALIFILTFTPFGFIQLPFIKATIIHIPVIVGSIILGPKRGAFLGFLFGLASLINNSINPTISSFVFTPFYPLPGKSSGTALALIVCFIPRILVGITPYFTYQGLMKIPYVRLFALPIAGLVGSLTNTLLVMHLIFFLFKDQYAAVKNIATSAVYDFILTIIATNGIMEAIAAMVVTSAFFTYQKRLLEDKKNSSLDSQIS